MTTDRLTVRAVSHLHRLCVEISSRRVGSPGNRAATDYFANNLAPLGFEIETQPFDCIDWSQAGARLSVEGASFEVFPSPYSLGCQARALLVVVSTVAELEQAELSRKIVLLRGEIAREQLMPKNFPFYNPDHHQHIIGLLETKQPIAILAATSRDVVMVGSQYPFPLFEDGDFDIPSVYMTEEEGARLAEYAGQEVWLESLAQRIPATGANVIARKGLHQHRRVTLFAHIDSRLGTPGANDNASGVVVLLLLAELLADYAGELGVEIVAMNGEDYFSSPGEQQYLARNRGRMNEIILGINLDDVAYHKGRIACSLYDCPEALAAQARRVFSAYPRMVEGEPWYQGDHGLFLINQVPALAITSELLNELMAEITHTPKDTPDIIDPTKLAEIALALKDLILKLDRH